MEQLCLRFLTGRLFSVGSLALFDMGSADKVDGNAPSVQVVHHRLNSRPIRQSSYRFESILWNLESGRYYGPLILKGSPSPAQIRAERDTLGRLRRNPPGGVGARADLSAEAPAKGEALAKEGGQGRVRTRPFLIRRRRKYDSAADYLSRAWLPLRIEILRGPKITAPTRLSLPTDMSIPARSPLKFRFERSTSQFVVSPSRRGRLANVSESRRGEMSLWQVGGWHAGCSSYERGWGRQRLVPSSFNRAAAVRVFRTPGARKLPEMNLKFAQTWDVQTNIVAEAVNFSKNLICS